MTSTTPHMTTTITSHVTKPPMADPNDSPEAIVSQFVFERLLNQDSQGRRIILLGSIKSKPALLLAERAAFSTSQSHLRSFISTLHSVTNLGNNDIYRWYLANANNPATSGPKDSASVSDEPATAPHDLKLNLIYPCTAKHVAKYTPQRTRYVVETASIYAERVRPYVISQREEGRLTWVYNILEGKTEVEDVLYRSWEHEGQGDRDAAATTTTQTEGEDKRFLLLPDLNWDRKTLSSLHLLALPLRRDKMSVRDLRVTDVPWLREMLARLEAAIESLYGPRGNRGTPKEGDEEEVIERDQVKFYLHYQPTYYHMHVHIVATALDATATQAVGKALDLRSVIATLEALGRGGLGGPKGMDELEIGYTVGEGSDLWEKVWAPLKKETAEAST